MKRFLTRPSVLIGLAYVALVAIYFVPAFFGRVVVESDYDVFLYLYPLFDFYSTALHHGQSFLWLPGVLSGFPVYLAQTGGVFDPLNLIVFKTLSVLPGMHLRIAIDLFLICISSYAAARALGLSRIAAFLVGPSYLLAFDWRYLSNLAIPNALFLLPLLIYCIVEGLRDSGVRWRFIFLGGAGIGWAILCGHIQVVFYALVFAILFLCGHLLFIDQSSALRPFVRRLGAFALMLLMGITIGLVQLLPAARFLPLTSRGTPSEYALTTQKSIDPGDLVLTLVPSYFYVPYVTAGRKPLFVGVLWFVLACGALIVSGTALWKRRSRALIAPRDRRMIVVSGLFLFAFIAALKWSPLYYLLNQLPGFSSFRFPSRFMFLGAFLLSLLGAFGFDRLRELRESASFRRLTVFLTTCVGLSASILAGVQLLSSSGVVTLAHMLQRVFALLFQGHLGFSKDPAAYQQAIAHGLGAYRELLSYADPAVTFPLMLTGAALLLLVRFVYGRLSPARMRAYTTLLTIVTIVTMAVIGWRSFGDPHLTEGADLPVLSSSTTELHQYRLYSFLPEYSAKEAIPPQYQLSDDESHAMLELLNAGLIPNLHLRRGLSSVDGYDQFEPMETLAAMKRVGGILFAGYSTTTPDARRDTLLKNLDLLGMMGGKYIVSGMPLTSPALKLVATTSVSEYGMILSTYTNTRALPIYYLAKSRANVPHTSFSDLTSHSDLKWGSITYLDCTDCAAPGTGALTLENESNGDYTFTVSADAPTYLVLSMTNVPGWLASLDGQTARIIRANGLYMAVAVPKGKHTVRFVYAGMYNELRVLEALGIVRP